MKSIKASLAGFCFLLFMVNAFQAIYGQGLVFDDEAYARVPQKEVSSAGAKAEDEVLGKTFQIDLKPYCPSRGQQGEISSCVGWSVGYGAMTIQEAISLNLAGQQDVIDARAYSPMFLFNQIKIGTCDFGSELNEAFKFIQEHGNVRHQDFMVGQDCDSVPHSHLLQKARVNAIKNYVTLFKPSDRDDVKVNRVKMSLVDKKPVVIGMVILQNFLSLKSGDEVWYPSIGKTDIFGGHAMVVVGFDEGRKAFEVMNSWGEGWGNKGFIWIRYEDFIKHCKYAYQFVLDDKKTDFLEGDISLLKPSLKMSEDNKVIFSTLPVSLVNKKYHVFCKGLLPLEFQMVVENIRKGSHLYIVGFDKNLKGAVYWPQNQKLNPQFFGMNASPKITEDFFSLTLPGKYNVFRISDPGVEYLCMLNASEEISGLPQKIQKVATGTGDLISRLEAAFKSISFAEAQITDKMSFFKTVDKNEIVSMVFELDSQK